MSSINIYNIDTYIIIEKNGKRELLTRNDENLVTKIIEALNSGAKIHSVPPKNKWIIELWRELRDKCPEGCGEEIGWANAVASRAHPETDFRWKNTCIEKNIEHWRKACKELKRRAWGPGAEPRYDFSFWWEIKADENYVVKIEYGSASSYSRVWNSNGLIICDPIKGCWREHQEGRFPVAGICNEDFWEAYGVEGEEGVSLDVLSYMQLADLIRYAYEREDVEKLREIAKEVERRIETARHRSTAIKYINMLHAIELKIKRLLGEEENQ